MALLQMYVPVDCYKRPLGIENTKRLIPSPGSQEHTCSTPQRPETVGPMECSQTMSYQCVVEHRLKSCALGFAYLYEALLLRCAAPIDSEGGNGT
jgi:hypothetical protein